jgi:predicted nuclease of predicted toxin-antitoxin system
MRLLADAHISRAMTAYLVGLGHDFLHAASLPPKTSDSVLLQRATEEARIVLTADKDFGELCFLRLMPCSGVVLLRLTAASESARLAVFRQFWPTIEQNVQGHFVVVTDKSVRRSPLPFAKE